MQLWAQFLVYSPIVVTPPAGEPEAYMFVPTRDVSALPVSLLSQNMLGTGLLPMFWKNPKMVGYEIALTTPAVAPSASRTQ